MMSASDLIGKFFAKAKSPRVPDGMRVYAIGDIHGQRDLLWRLLLAIVEDINSRSSIYCYIIFLGDYIDRGEYSADLLRIFKGVDPAENIIFLKGNHEQVLVDVLDGKIEAAIMWSKIGGLATLKSFGVGASVDAATDPCDIIKYARQYIDQDTKDWLISLRTHFEIGDYYFVHAGIRPGRALSKQEPYDQLWIRAEFTSSKRKHGPVIVHGHTINAEGALFAPNRIGIDTGAYKTGRLTALALEGDAQWVVGVHDPSLVSAHKSRADRDDMPRPGQAGTVSP